MTTVALTRPDVGSLGPALEAEGALVVRVPLIEIAPPADGGAALDTELGRLDEFDWLAVTSANGARAVGRAAAEHPRVKLAAVGLRTAAALAALAGREVDLVPADQRAAGLVAAFPPAPGRVLVAQADRAGGELVDGLLELGADVTAVEAYRTLPRTPSAEELAILDTADAIVLASPSAADSLVAALRVPPTVRIVALGPTTATAATRLGLDPVVSASPADSDVVAAVFG